MKRLAFILAFSAVSAFATDYRCVSSTTGKTYELSTTYGEISVLNKAKQEIGSFDGLSVKLKHFRAPEADLLTFTDSEDGSLVAEVYETPRFITASVKNDKNLTCIITR